MKKELVQIKLHGHLGKSVKKSNWSLAVKSVAEAISAINNFTNNKLKKRLIKDHKDNLKYNVLINGRDFEHDGPVEPHVPESIGNSELCIKGDYIKTIDIIPVIEGAGDGLNILTMIVAIVLIVVGAMMTVGTLGGGAPLGYAMIMAGLGLFAAGLANLLSKPPKPGEVDQSIGSYMFNGPQNTAEEGNPIPVGYGRLLAGSQIVAASYDVDYLSADPADKPTYTS